MRPMPISPETAQKLAKELHVPLEHIMHMPQHILLQKLSELAAKQHDADTAPDQQQVKPDHTACLSLLPE